MPSAAVNTSSGKFSSPSQFLYTKLDPNELAKILTSPTGDVARDLIERGERVKLRAKKLVGVSQPDPVPRRREHRPGTLRDSIVKRMLIRNGRLVVQVGTDVPYAYWHHEGWKGGIIITPKAGAFLVFYWKKTGKVHYARQVRQGSFKGNPFLRNALVAAKD